ARLRGRRYPRAGRAGRRSSRAGDRRAGCPALTTALAPPRSRSARDSSRAPVDRVTALEIEEMQARRVDGQLQLLSFARRRAGMDPSDEDRALVQRLDELL